MPICRTRGTLAVALIIMCRPWGPQAADGPKYKADVPPGLMTPDVVQTEMLGELEFFDGMPSDATVKKTFDFIDLSRAVDSFLNGIPAASIYADVGRPQAGRGGTGRPGALGKPLRRP